MKTSAYKFVYATGILVSIATVLMTLTIASYMVYNTKFLMIEGHVMMDRIVTLCAMLKLTGFLNAVIGLFTAYALNIRNKMLMLGCQYVVFPVFLITIYLIYLFSDRYAKEFSTLLPAKMYETAAITISIRMWDPEAVGSVEQVTKSTAKMRALCEIFVKYNVTMLVLMVLTVVLLHFARRMRIEREEAKVPVITELSRVGLNTASLRSKRVVVGRV